MPVTAGEFREWLSHFPADTPIVIDVNTDEGFICTSRISNTRQTKGRQGPRIFKSKSAGILRRAGFNSALGVSI